MTTTITLVGMKQHSTAELESNHALVSLFEDIFGFGCLYGCQYRCLQACIFTHLVTVRFKILYHPFDSKEDDSLDLSEAAGNFIVGFQVSFQNADSVHSCFLYSSCPVSQVTPHSIKHTFRPPFNESAIPYVHLTSCNSKKGKLDNSGNPVVCPINDTCEHVFCLIMPTTPWFNGTQTASQTSALVAFLSQAGHGFSYHPYICARTSVHTVLLTPMETCTDNKLCLQIIDADTPQEVIWTYDVEWERSPVRSPISLYNKHI